MKVRIDRDRDGWRYFTIDENGERVLSLTNPVTTYNEAKRRALAANHEIDNAGWRHKMLSWNWNMHAIDGYPEWEQEIYPPTGQRSPAFVKLSHVRGKGDVESNTLCNEWDDVAEVDFYQRDWTDDGIPFVNAGDTYWSGWWFATIAERDRFLAWFGNRNGNQLGRVVGNDG